MAGKKTVPGYPKVYNMHSKLYVLRNHLLICVVVRMVKARKLVMEMRYLSAVIRIQSFFRGYMARREKIRYHRKIVLIQCCYRRRKAIRELKQLKVEAKSVGKLQEINYKLDNKVVELSQALQAKTKENHALSEKVSSLESHMSTLKEKYSKMETLRKTTSTEALAGTAEIKKQLAAANESLELATRQNEKYTNIIKKKEDEISHLQEEVTNTKKALRDLEQEQKTAPPVPSKGNDSETIANLQKEILALRDQVARLLAGKYKADKITDSRKSEIDLSNHSPRVQQVFPMTQSTNMNHLQGRELDDSPSTIASLRNGAYYDDTDSPSSGSPMPEMDVCSYYRTCNSLF